MREIIISAIVVAVCGFGLFAYIEYINGHMTSFAQSLDKDAQLRMSKGWSWFTAKLLGWKTIIAAWISAVFGMIAAIPADIINTWTGLPWAQVFDQKVAAIISIICGLVIPIFHAQGMSKAAAQPPAGTDSAS